MNAEINAGIIDLAREGCLSAASCLSRGKVFRQDAHLLAELPIEKGLHLNLTESLDGKDFFQPLPKLIWKCFTRRIDPNVIKAEIEYQLDAFESTFSQAPDYVDGHQHVHQFPIVRDCLIEIMLRRYRGQPLWLRSTIHPKHSKLPISLRLKGAVIEFLGTHSLKDLANQFEIKSNSHLLGVYSFDGGEGRYAELLNEWIRLAGPKDLIMCHPARGLNRSDPIGEQRCAEYAVLSGVALSRLLEQQQACIAPNMRAILSE